MQINHLTVFTCRQESEELCLGELMSAEEGVALEKWLDGGVGIAAHSSPFDEFSARLRERRPIFTRHLFPLEHTADISEPFEAEAAIKRICAEYMKRLSPGESISVQVRRDAASGDSIEGDTGRTARLFSDYMTGKGMVYNAAEPRRIISIYLGGGALYSGMSPPEGNLSSWPGGMMRFKRDDGMISRAEFKLLEAIAVFRLRLDGGAALDLGAAPGGWTRLLIERGYRVTAVDPAALHPSLAADERVVRFSGVAQDFLSARSDARFDLIVNDMRMDVAASADIMLDACDRLAEGGRAVMTFKLPERGKAGIIKKGMSKLARRYIIEDARQLFHNRSEITLLLGKR